MTEDDLVLTLDKQFKRMAKNRVGTNMVAHVRSLDGVRAINVCHGDWAKCRSRFDRWNLIRSKIHSIKEK